MELRVHGVGGPAPESVLRRSDPARSPVDGEVTSAAWRSEPTARSAVRWTARDRTTRVYHWAPLTSGSRWFALWPVLLPFTLVNAAGWMAPRTRGPAQPLATWHRAVVALLGLITTLAATVWLYWLGQVLVEHPWAGDLGPTAARAGGFAASTLALAAVVLVATFTAEGYDRYSPEDPPGTAAPTSSTEDRRRLTSRRLYDDAAHRRLWWRIHVAVVVVAGLGAGREIALARTWPDAAHDLARAAWWVGIAQLVAVAALLVIAGLALLRPERATDPDRPMAFVGAATAALGTGLVPILTATAASVALGAAKVPGDDALVVVPAAGLAAWIVAAAAGITAARRLLRPAPVEGLRTTTGEADLSTVFGSPMARLRSRVATIPTSLGPVAAALAFGLPASIVLDAVIVTGDGTGWWHEELAPVVTAGWLVSTTRWLVVGLIGFMVLSVWRTRADAPSRQRVGNIWDVLTFWPRTYQPFAVRPYAERAVPELRHHIEALAGRGEPVTVIAHSQGSVLALAALAPLAAPTPSPLLGPVRLVTMGSPLRTLYARIFPNHIDPDLIARVQLALDDHGGGWVNAFRPTDHIGRAVFSADGDVLLPTRDVEGRSDRSTRSGDHVLPDPPRPGAAIAGHSGYWTDPAFEELAAPTPALAAASPPTEEAP